MHISRHRGQSFEDRNEIEVERNIKRNEIGNSYMKSGRSGGKKGTKNIVKDSQCKHEHARQSLTSE